METDNNEDPAWLNSKNDRKTPYTDEEIEYFVNDFIHENYDHQEVKMLLQVHDELLFEIRMDFWGIVGPWLDIFC